MICLPEMGTLARRWQPGLIDVGIVEIWWLTSIEIGSTYRIMVIAEDRMPGFSSDIERKASVIKKRAVPIVIQTSKQLIRGKFHVRGVMRVIDEMTFEDKFVAITDAEIINPNGRVLFHTKFVAVNRHEIVWMAPEEDIISKGVTARLK
jgi:hypothetical protein